MFDKRAFLNNYQGKLTLITKRILITSIALKIYFVIKARQ